MLIYSVLRKVRNCATKQKMWQIISILFRVLTENFYIVPFPCKFRFSFGGKFKFTKETLNFKKTRPLRHKTKFAFFSLQFGRPGFKTLLLALSSKWNSNKDKLMESGDKIMEAMEGASSLSTTSAGNLPQASEVQKNCFNQLLRSYDSEMGGFSKAPKFPQPVNFNFLFHYYSLKPKDDRAKQGLKMALHTLDMMAKGGIHDHVSQVSSNSFPTSE